MGLDKFYKGGSQEETPRRGCVLRIEEDSPQPRYLAAVRDGRQHLPLRCGGLLGDPTNKSLRGSPINFTYEPQPASTWVSMGVQFRSID
jgi:hypothetical protein